MSSRNILISLLFLCFSSLSQAENVKIAIFEWCPFICPNDSAKPGVLVEYITQIFEESGHTVSFQELPWSRAIKSTETGKIHGLLGAAKNEAPNLRFGQGIIGQQKMCVYKRKGESWTYSKPADMADKSVIYIQDALPAELTSISAPKLKAKAYTENYLNEVSKMLGAKRIDGYMMTQFTMLTDGKKFLENTEAAGCFEPNSLYLAFSSATDISSTIDSLIKDYDASIQTLESNQTYQTLLAKYGLSD